MNFRLIFRKVGNGCALHKLLRLIPKMIWRWHLYRCLAFRTVLEISIPSKSKNGKKSKKGFTHFAEGDIGVAKITPCFQNRKSVIFKNLISGYGAGTTELTVVRTINKTVLPEYLLWFFKSEYFIANGVKSFTGTAGQQRIHKDYLATCLVPLPPLAEQKRIVAKLEEILPLCERLK